MVRSGDCLLHLCYIGDMNKRFSLSHVKMRVAMLVVLGIFVFALALLGVGLGYTALARNSSTDNTANTVAVRDLVVRALEGTKSAAPLDPKTGDVYFPPTKYYLPASAVDMASLTYAYNKDAGLSVTSRLLVGQATAPMYSTGNINQLFNALPHAQACQRGVRVVNTKLTEDGIELKQTLTVNGSTLYLYTEKACTEQADLVEMLKSLKTY